MLRCSPEAFAKCQTRHICGKIEDATFMEGSECDRFNQSVMNMPVTNADRIRAMSDEELAVLFADDERACPPKHLHCSKYVDKCNGCWLEWLRQPAKEVL